MEEMSEEACSPCNDDSQHTDEGGEDMSVCELESFVTGCVDGKTDANREGKQKPPLALEERQPLKKTHMDCLLEDLNLKKYYDGENISLKELLAIDKNTINDVPLQCKSDIPWYFLKKLMMVNVTARNVKCESNSNDVLGSNELNLDCLLDSSNSDNMVNPLDIVTALFLCSDGFAQQEMALKMSMCQFSVPLLLPNCDTKRSTLMLWAMRDTVKRYRPKHLLESKGFIEERIVHCKLPMISFVRLGECSLSKSEILNKLLSNSQQCHDTFVHRNMESGDSPRRISDGLAEISWYLPCGNKNMDIFVEPVALANLRGDIASFETQFSFLCLTSAAVFVFFDHLDSGCELLINQSHKAQIFLVGNLQSENLKLQLKDALKNLAKKLGLTNNHIVLKTKQTNDADFVQCLRKKVSDVVEHTKMKMPVEEMVDIAHELGILVDEDAPECQVGKKYADEITAAIKDTVKYKEEQLPLQGQIWKDLTCLEKEEFRLRNVGSENIDQYRINLQKKKEELRTKQNSFNMSPAIGCFINAISSPGTERCYFLKWMRMNLDNMSRVKLSGLREQYEEKCKDSENKEEINNIDRQLSNSSLGTEHFFREMGQIYEASFSLPETYPSRQQLQHLPNHCAKLLLDGFPLELVDGDASNIPLRWVSDVLAQLNKLVSPQNKILVVTVLGVQSTGKSTLLNTMFGVQFAVSSGRCTRGAFMLLIKVNQDIKTLLNCDFMVIIDTEGLKSPELAQLDNSHEHDNELATLVVGLSDMTIVNIAMENSTEIKDILQIVVHAFLRMKEVGKKPKCQFVHQNVSDVSAHGKNLRDRKLLLQQLNEMTQAAAKMEKKEKNKSFTDVMEYSPDTGNCYVPGLWNGNPPMAPVNAGYSEAVYELKKNIFQQLGTFQSSATNILEFIEWMTSLWNSVKHENFLFSFRNSLVADAYIRLCTEFNQWEWEFKKEMYTWVTNAETRIRNFGTVAALSPVSDMTELLTELKGEAATVLSEWETRLLDNLKKYFKQTDGHVYLVERYREEFSNSAKSLRKEMERSIINQLTAAADIRRGMTELDQIKEKHRTQFEDRVRRLIDECHARSVEMTEEELDEEFDKIWRETEQELSSFNIKPTNINSSISNHLRTNLSTKGSYAFELLSKRSLQDCGAESFKYRLEGFLKQAKHKFRKILDSQDHTKIQKMADDIISTCTELINEKIERKTNYHETYIQEILHTIDEMLQKNQQLSTDVKFEVSLKQHICGKAAQLFQKMHNDFLSRNDPCRCLQNNKEQFHADFKDIFLKKDQCQKKAEEFTTKCLKPAVEDFINRSLGPDIIDEMLTKEQFSTRISFQHSILQDLLKRDDFKDYVRYISSYEDYAKEWILHQTEEHFSKEATTFGSEDRHIKSCISCITNAIDGAKRENSVHLRGLIEDICKKLGDKLVLSQDALGAFMTLNNADKEQFVHSLRKCVADMGQTLRAMVKKEDIKMKLKHLHLKPENELFTKLIGCGHQCPFCEAPCEAGEKAHTEHFASLHRPIGLGTCRSFFSHELSTDICSTLVVTDRTFTCDETNGAFHPFKRYKEIFPRWKIVPDVSLEASDFWKYVLTKHNHAFAKEYKAKPARIPNPWKSITPEQAEKSLKQSFRIM
ncbi:up-regulator of cell proliferation isoform 2-T2 [Menidia menidia]